MLQRLIAAPLLILLQWTCAVWARDYPRTIAPKPAGISNPNLQVAHELVQPTTED